MSCFAKPSISSLIKSRSQVNPGLILSIVLLGPGQCCVPCAQVNVTHDAPVSTTASTKASTSNLFTNS